MKEKVNGEKEEKEKEGKRKLKLKWKSFMTRPLGTRPAAA
jgi:hypothetical protein